MASVNGEIFKDFYSVNAFFIPVLFVAALLAEGCIAPDPRFAAHSADIQTQPRRFVSAPAVASVMPISKSVPNRVNAPVCANVAATTDDADFGEALDDSEEPTAPSADFYRPDSSVCPKAGLFKEVETYLGTHYRSGGTTPDGMDCSGFVWRVYVDLGMQDFKRQSAQDIFNEGKPVEVQEAVPGDLVFFKRGFRVYHVGIYMGGGRFAHSSSSLGVSYASLSEEYYHAHFAGIRRFGL